MDQRMQLEEMIIKFRMVIKTLFWENITPSKMDLRTKFKVVETQFQMVTTIISKAV